MTRNKVKLAYITSNSLRNASYKKRKRSIIKKVNELSTLCDVQACAIIYNQDEQVPEVWPSQQGALDVIERFNDLSMLQKTRYMVNQNYFVGQLIQKSQVEFDRLQNKNRENAVDVFLYQCNIGMADVNQFTERYDFNMDSFLNQAMGYILSRINELK